MYFFSTEDKTVKKAVNALLERCECDVKGIKTCADCFEHFIIDRNDYFTRVCAKPHLLVFAKMDGYPFWPAKLMSIDGDTANIEFFGDHTQNDIPLKKCYLYSETFVKQNPKNRGRNDAIEVIYHNSSNK